MHDPRVTQLAQVLTHYSAGVKNGDLVRIGGELAALPLLEAIYEESLLAGAHPFLQILSDTADESFFRLATNEQLAFVSPLNQHMIETIDVYFGIRAPANTRSRSNVPPEKQTLATKARKPFLDTLLARAAQNKLRWTGTQYPTFAAAQDAEMSLHEYEHFVFHAGLLHLPDPVAAWKALSEKQQRLADHLMKKKEIRVIAPGTDLLLGIQGRTWINCDGHQNFPDGEVYTAPIEDSVNGTIRFSFPAIQLGKEVHDIVLTFKHGRVVDASASKGQEFLFNMLDLDPGARTLGEFAIGTNFGITQHTKNILFDEKIGGTCHAALGASYPQSGGTNNSALHWDMVCDLRTPGCSVEADSNVILAAGKFTSTQWPN